MVVLVENVYGGVSFQIASIVYKVSLLPMVVYSHTLS